MAEGLITVDIEKQRAERFSRFLAVTTDMLRCDARANPAYYSKQNGEKLEMVVLEKMRMLAADFDLSAEKIKPAAKQHFPDILVGDNYGVEVKSTKGNTWVSTGSSIVESLRDEQVQRVYMMFGRLYEPDIDFRCKPYEECLYDISVTHSPRYLINMDLSDSSQTIFSKMHTPYDNFRNADNQISIVRQYYRDKFRREKRRGEMPWWIGDDVSGSLPSALQQSGGLRMMNILDEYSKRYLTLCGFILFPEILGKSMTKYQNFALWLCSRHSVICSSLRDEFSAGGKGNIYINDRLKWGSVPKIICNLFSFVNDIRNVFTEHNGVYDEISYYADYYKSGEDLKVLWERCVQSHFDKLLGKDRIQVRDLLRYRFDHATVNDFYGYEIDC